MSTKLRRGRSRVAVLAVVAMVAGLLALPISAGAATAACPDTIPSAGFTDMAGYSTAAQDAVDCIAYYGVTAGVGGGLYGPAQNVPRWQMAIFLASVLETGGATLDTSDFGFTDISGKSTAAQDAINAIANAGVTAGVGGGLYGPDIDVPRWQMAIFLASVLEELGVTIDTTSFGFTDIDGKSTAAQDAINAIANAGISVGTGGGLFAPDAEVTRVQMALFLAAELDEAGVVPAGEIAVLPSDSALLELKATSYKATRTYTASVANLDKVSLQLWSAADVNTSGLLVSPTSTAVDAVISVVNGVATGATSAQAVIKDVVPSGGTVTFTVEYADTADDADTYSQNPVGVFPAVFSGTAVTGVAGATATAPKAPTNDAFATGGVAKTWKGAPSAAGYGTIITAGDKDLNFFQGLFGGDAWTWFYDDNHSFKVAGVPANAADFEKSLSRGDSIIAVPYTTESALVSAFDNADNEPAAPTGLVAAAGTPASSAVNLDWNDGLAGATYSVKRATTAGGPYTTIATGLTKSEYKDSGLAAATTYYYVVSQTSDGDESANSAEVNITTAALTETVKPKILDLYLDTDGGVAGILDVGDVIDFEFDEEMAAPAASWLVRVSDDDSVYQISASNGTAAFFDGNESTDTNDGHAVTVTGALTLISGTDNGIDLLEVNEVVAVQGFRDLALNAVDLAGSTDKFLEE